MELIQSIREAEKKAEELIRAARQGARRAVKDAEKKAAAASKKQLAAVENEALELIRRAEKEAQNEAGPLRGASGEEVTALRTGAGARMPQALAMIKERIIPWPS